MEDFDLQPGSFEPLDDSGVQDAFTSGVAPAAARAPGATPNDARVFEAEPPEVDVASMYPSSDGLCVIPHVVNTICSIDIGRTVDLRVLACAARNVEYDPARATAVLRLRNPTCGAIIRQSGAVTMSGASTVAHARRGAMLVARVVRAALGWQDELSQVVFKVKSLTLRFDLRHPVRLEDVAAAHPTFCTYEPDAFCGLHMRLRGVCDGAEWAAVLTVYVSGKVIMSGVKTPAQIRCAYHAALPIIAPFAKGAKTAEGV